MGLNEKPRNISLEKINLNLRNIWVLGTKYEQSLSYQASVSVILVWKTVSSLWNISKCVDPMEQL